MTSDRLGVLRRLCQCIGRIRSRSLVEAPALVLVAWLALMVAARVPFACDLLDPAESPFMTDVMKIANGQPLFGPADDLNSSTQSSVLSYVAYALLRPLGRHLDVRAARLLAVAVGLLTAWCLAVLVTLRERNHQRAADVGESPPTSRAARRVAFLVATLLVFASDVADVPHRDDLYCLHAVALLLLCTIACDRRARGSAFAAAALSGVGVLTRPTAVLAPVGVLVTLLAGGRWNRRTAAALMATASIVTTLALISLSSLQARAWVLEPLLAATFEGKRLWAACDVLFRGRHVLLLLLAAAATLDARPKRASSRSVLVLGWFAIGMTEVAPVALQFFLTDGSTTDITVVAPWLFVIAWPMLARALRGDLTLADVVQEVQDGSDASSSLHTLRLSGAVLLILVLFPWKAVPSEPAETYCGRLVEAVVTDVHAHRTVVLAEGTTPLLQAGLHDVPKDRAASLAEAIALGRTADTRGMLDRMRSGTYDRIYANDADYHKTIQRIRAPYVEVARIAGSYAVTDWSLSFEPRWQNDMPLAVDVPVLEKTTGAGPGSASPPPPP